MIDETVSHYRIIEKLGQGGMGVVYKAEDTRLRRPVALKFLSDALSQDLSAVERFQREARAASGLNHPHISAVYDVGEHNGRPFIVMELLQGASLQQQIAAGPLRTDRIIELGIQLADALEVAHQQHIVHRDIKPGNIFVTARHEAKLLDFGLAKPALETIAEGAAPTEARLTGSGAVLGTLAYMSPEQVRGEALDARTDLFSLGAVLYEMATGRQAFPGATSGTVQEAILNRSPVPAGRVNPDVPSRLEDVINKALEKDRALRYQTASEIRTDLLRLKRDTGSAPAAVESDSTIRRKRPWPHYAALIAGLLALGVLIVAGIRIAGARGTSAIDSIAVLPFANSSANPDSEYLSDGITESLINNLSQLPTLRVIARSTVFRYKGQQTDPQKVGQDLGVRAVLSGRVMQRGSTLIVSTELMDVETGAQLWGGQYNRERTDVFALQDELSTDISEKLRLRLTREDKERLTRRYTDDATAYQMYLRGRYHWNQRSPEGLQRAVEYFNQAVAADPAYALAYAGLADTYNLMSFFNILRPREAMPQAKAAAVKALQIDPSLAEAHISLGYSAYTFDWDWAASTRHFDRALALNREAVMKSNSYPFYLTVAGRHEEAIRVAKAAVESDPVSASVSHTLVVQLALAGRLDEAIDESRRTIEIDPDFAVAHDVLAYLLVAKGRHQEALAESRKAVALNPVSPMFKAGLGYVHAQLGQPDAARQVIRELTTVSTLRYTPALAFAVVHLGLGEPDQALDWLEKGYEERFIRLAYLRREPVWDPVRGDPRFQDLVRRIGLPE
jgi:serine/threonine protein kinase/Tfp pilus assembly protein PilF